jgi:hypothetical protein
VFPEETPKDTLISHPIRMLSCGVSLGNTLSISLISVLFGNILRISGRYTN